jgi:cellulose synthase/poly-beta-1,6-N-acetylglucosamine synthase-like glycosyltransferase
LGGSLLAGVHAFAVVWLSVYGFQALLLTVLFWRHRRDALDRARIGAGEWPTVAVQLPVYNERHVIERLIDAAVALDYPRDRLEIQVLDDSSDETTDLAEARAAYHRARGTNVRVVRRPDRLGYKAGALAWGLTQTNAEFIAVFDADFNPAPSFLRSTISALVARPDAGMVQTRWAHLNESYSLLTRVQALALDGHFVIEQTGRNRSGFLINFNGSGGVWRRICIEKAGGWQSDTMTEDMDLSYRAQLAGWRCLYAAETEAPAELPPQMEAFKRQQARWAQGSTQCLRKLGPSILRSNLTPGQKLMAIVHIASYLTQPIMLFILLASLPLVLTSQQASGLVGWLWLASLGPPLLYTVAQTRLHRDWPRRMLYFPLLAVVTVGITWSTTCAVWKGLFGWGGQFLRTPKFRLEGNAGDWSASRYRLRPNAMILGEIALTGYAVATSWAALSRGEYGMVPFLLLYVIGFGVVAASSFWQGRGAAAVAR